jgi:hypothetical protein
LVPFCVLSRFFNFFGMSSNDETGSSSGGSDDVDSDHDSEAGSGSESGSESGSSDEKTSEMSAEQLAKSVAAVFGAGEAMRVTFAAILERLRSEELKLSTPDGTVSRQPPSEASVRFDHKVSRNLAASRHPVPPLGVDVGVQAEYEEKQSETRVGRHCHHCGRHRSRSRSTDGLRDKR